MDKFYGWLAYRLPQRLVYFCTIRLLACGCAGKYSKTSVNSVRAKTVLRRWEK